MKRCETCIHWKDADPSHALGLCQKRDLKLPVWAKVEGSPITHYLDGRDCKTFDNTKRKPHLLDATTKTLMAAKKGDHLTMRTLNRGGERDYRQALVLGAGRIFVDIELFNARHRLRIHRTAAGLAGTAASLPGWGVDPSKPLDRGNKRTERPERAVEMLTGLKRGDRIPVIGYPPLDSVRKQARVMVVGRQKLTLRLGRRKVWMYRTGPMAGIIENDIFVLDTTEERP